MINFPSRPLNFLCESLSENVCSSFYSPFPPRSSSVSRSILLQLAKCIRFDDVFSNKCDDDRRKSSDTKVSLWKIFIFLELRVDIKEGNFALSRIFFENSWEKLGMMEVIKFRRLYERRWFGSFKARSSSAE